MKLKRNTRLAALCALAVSGALTLGACGSDDNSGSGSSTGSATGTSASDTAASQDIKCAGKGELRGSGSSAQKNAVDKWVNDFQAACKDVTVNYQATGSGAGIQTFLQGNTAFAGTDTALTSDEVEKSKKVCKDGQAIDLPMLGGPIAVGYNVKGVDKLVLDADTLAKIFDGRITTWNDDAIKKLNSGADLPDTKIQPISRSDESGTTDNFTKYLSAAAPDAWKYKASKKWPVEGGQSADGSSGVASQVKQTDGAISYFELSYATANDIKAVSLDTGASSPVEATSENATKALAAAKVTGTGKDLSLELDYKTTAEGAYPITLVTYEVVCDKGNKSDSLDALKSFLTYTSSEKGQSELKNLGYAELPSDIADKVRSTVKSLS
ncbi:phosphate ABC transporter substrate-binding protein PstS [Streptomyces polyrhachis]|uniref:Phosphate-binding protein n=1 Tax=Streptomyces polyrhachis TaxID=1282885 RepID=A0ABW2GG06_9ACTN